MKIESSIPVPDRKTARKYDFPNMEVGDSFLSPDRRVASAASTYGKKTGRKFQTQKRTMESDGEEGFRTWRTA